MDSNTDVYKRQGIALFFEQGGQPQHRGKGLFHLVLDFLFRQGEKGLSLIHI